MANKRPSDNSDLPAAKRVANNPDVMGCLISMYAQELRDVKKELTDLRESHKYLHRQFERLDKYANDLEIKIDTYNGVLSAVIQKGPPFCDVVTENVIGIPDAVPGRQDIIDMLLEYETEEEDYILEITGWLDEQPDN